MTGQIERITLESLLSDNYFNQDYSDVPEDPAEVVIECMDILSELNELEQNMIALEAGKAIKKVKSSSKKKKIIKSKMKAKDAKAKKAGGKVIRIVKESDAELDGGTGPQPTTTDTMGMSDTDLDADPEAKVQVTEIVDSISDESVIVGMEGVDFIVEYEDETIVKMEASLGENLKAFGAKIKEMLKKIGTFIQSVWKKFIGLFQNMDLLIKDNQAAIDAGLKDEKKMISTKYRFSGNGATDVQQVRKLAEDTFKEVSDTMAKTESMDVAGDIKTGIELGELSKVAESIFADVPEGKISITKCGIGSTADLDAIAGKKQQKDFDTIVKCARKSIADGEKAIGKAVNKNDPMAKAAFGVIKAGCVIMQKAIGEVYKVNGKAISFAIKVARAAQGGASAPAAAS